MKNANDNEPLELQPIAIALARVVRHLQPDVIPEKDEKENPGGDSDPGDTDKERPEDQRRYIDHRLREIAAWEKRINGGRKV